MKRQRRAEPFAHFREECRDRRPGAAPLDSGRRTCRSSPREGDRADPTDARGRLAGAHPRNAGDRSCGPDPYSAGARTEPPRSGARAGSRRRAETCQKFPQRPLGLASKNGSTRRWQWIADLRPPLPLNASEQRLCQAPPLKRERRFTRPGLELPPHRPAFAKASAGSPLPDLSFEAWQSEGGGRGGTCAGAGWMRFTQTRTSASPSPRPSPGGKGSSCAGAGLQQV